MQLSDALLSVIKNTSSPFPNGTRTIGVRALAMDCSLVVDPLVQNFIQKIEGLLEHFKNSLVFSQQVLELILLVSLLQ
jgi:hypothetical protein